MKVTLLKPHTHAGAEHSAGDVIEVSPAQAAWLAQQGVVAAAADATTGKGSK